MTGIALAVVCSRIRAHEKRTDMVSAASFHPSDVEIAQLAEVLMDCVAGEARS